MSRRQPVTLGDLRIADRATPKLAAFGQKLGPRRAMDRAVDPAAAEQGRIRGVDDGVNA
jgi:hypothetical protein